MKLLSTIYNRLDLLLNDEEHNYDALCTKCEREGRQSARWHGDVAVTHHEQFRFILCWPSRITALNSIRHATRVVP